MIPLIGRAFKAIVARMGHHPLMFILAVAWIATMAVWIGHTGYVYNGPIWGFVMVMVTIAAALIPEVAVSAWRNGRWVIAVAAAIASYGFVRGEMIGHSMAVSGMRGAEMASAKVEKVHWTNAQKDVTRIEADLERLRAILATQSQYGPPESFDDAIRAQDSIANQEGAKGRKGRGDCRTRCDAALKEAARLRGLKAIATARETETKPAIARLEKELEEAKATLKTTNSGFSKTRAHAVQYAKTVFNVVHPTDEQVERAETEIENFTILILALGGAALYLFSQQDFSGPKGPSVAWGWIRWAIMGGDKPTVSGTVSRETPSDSLRQPSVETVSKPSPAATVPAIMPKQPPTYGLNASSYAALRQQLRAVAA